MNGNFTKDKKFIGKMFDELSPMYDFNNHLLSGGQDLLWRKKAVKHLTNNHVKSETILDLASGSGDLAVEFLRLEPNKLVCADLSLEMLKINNNKINNKNHIAIQTDAGSLPFEDNTFDITGISFGVRNFENLETCIKEIYRTLKPGGLFLTIEMFGNRSPSFINKIFGFYFKKILPKIGNLLSKSKYAYFYLFDSVDTFLSAGEYTKLTEKCGFKTYWHKNNFINIVHTVIVQKPV
ncbi:MAG: ubiquinone/menaquinone biosynthesis methyltransferase [Ignavibacteriae bacterium]|nr:MAG: ubiquinone/menaquinone biosynthesis methyltransferase [Ignavibacteriota bacterium]